ncbi:MAG: YicC family protein [Gammaproteobacteria bacterium]|nr:YicC family protein [Gammaproteobacteria bacterium]
MIRSMTAFARKQGQGEWGALQLELRSVNHRYLELSPRLPDELRALEPKLRERIGRRLARGKVECNVRYQAPQAMAGELAINKELVKQLAHTSREVDAILYNPAPVNSLDVLRWPGVLESPGIDEAQLQQALLGLLDEALDELDDNRRREGDKLKAIILQRCDTAEAVVDAVRERLPEVLAGVRSRLQQRLEELRQELDQERLEQEMVLLAQKLDVDEEMDRLATHIEEVRRVLDSDEPVGRRLDFLMQELNREANTLGSKSADSETTRASVELKVLIEQMREQIQNIE